MLTYAASVNMIPIWEKYLFRDPVLKEGHRDLSSSFSVTKDRFATMPFSLGLTVVLALIQVSLYSTDVMCQDIWNLSLWGGELWQFCLLVWFIFSKDFLVLSLVGLVPTKVYLLQKATWKNVFLSVLLEMYHYKPSSLLQEEQDWKKHQTAFVLM